MDEENIEQDLSNKERYDQKREEREAGRNKRVRNAKIKKNSKWIMAIGVLVLIVFAMIFFSGSTFESSSLSLGVEPGDHVKGLLDSDIVLVEYSDLQCPACRAYYPVLKELVNEYGDKITFVYRHFPLSQIHPHAELASRVVEAAGVQGKFFEMHDLIFETQNEWVRSGNVPETFAGYARELGLNLEQFASDITSEEVVKKVNNDIRGGKASKVTGTPTFFLNKEKIKNPQSYEEFANLIEEKIKEIEEISNDEK